MRLVGATLLILAGVGIFVAILLAGWLPPTAASWSGFGRNAVDIVGLARVADGDTLDVGNERVRLFGIDAPEKDQSCATPSGKDWACGAVAQASLNMLLVNETVRCREQDRDPYGRIVAQCFVGEQDVGAWMVREGWAMAYRQYSWRYIPHELKARLDRTGVWVGSLVPPWEWRRAQ